MNNEVTIQTIRWELQTNDMQQAFYWQDQVSSFCQHQMNDIFERAFAYSQAEEDLVIDRLVLDLEQIFDVNDLPRCFEASLEKAVKKEVFQSATTPVSNSPEKLDSYSFIDQLIHYLKTSTLPWYAREIQFNDDDHLLQALTGCAPGGLINRMLEISPFDFAVNRLLFLFKDEENLQAFLIHLSGHILSSSYFILWKNLFEGLSNYPYNMPNDRVFYYRPLFRALLEEKNTSQKGKLYSAIAIRIFQENKFFAEAWMKKEVFQFTRDQLAHPVNEIESLFNQAILRMESDEGTGPVSVIERKNPEVPQNVTAGSKEMFVVNAGLVLLYPYLKTLFRNFQLMNDEKFISAMHQARAIQLLEFIVRGNNSSREYHLVLNKILCGVDLQVPLYMETVESTSELETDDFLISVMNNWENSGLVTIDGFRGSFLLRKGKLVDEGKFWQLTVEKKGWDVVMKSLRYPLGVIRLPWMIKPVYVEW